MENVLSIGAIQTYWNVKMSLSVAFSSGCGIISMSHPVHGAKEPEKGDRGMASVLLEVCCGSADDVIQAKLGGADRAELCSDLFHGGLTPTVGSLRVAKGETGMPIVAMIRPREGGFCYTEAEFATCIADAKLLLEHGADGLVFGFLHPDGTIDLERTRTIAQKRGFIYDRNFIPLAGIHRGWLTVIDHAGFPYDTRGEALCTAAGITGEELTHEEVQETADRVKGQFKQLIKEIVSRM